MSTKAYREANREYIATWKSAWYQRNKKRLAPAYSAYRKANKDRITEYKKQWSIKNAEKLKANSAVYRLENRIRLLESKRKWHHKNRDRIIAQKRKNQPRNRLLHAAYMARNPGLNAHYCRKYSSRHRANSSPQEIIAAEKKILAMKVLPIGICPYCDKELPQLKLSVEHVLPLSRGGKHEPDNVILACKACNSSKRDRILYEEWMPPKYQGSESLIA